MSINGVLINYQTEKKEIELWFKATDYYANKLIRGEWNETTPKWVAYKQEAAIKAARLNELETLIAQEKAK